MLEALRNFLRIYCAPLPWDETFISQEEIETGELPGIICNAVRVAERCSAYS